MLIEEKESEVVNKLSMDGNYLTMLLDSGQNNQRIKTIIFCILDHSLAALWTTKFSLLKIAILKRGDCQNFKVIGPEEMPILVWGRRKRPQANMGST